MALTKTPIELSSTPSIVDGGNATAITIDSSGNVGIGNISPSAPLDIKLAGTATADIFKFQRSDGAVAGVLNYNGTDGAISLGTTTAHPLVFQTNDTERMRIDSSGSLLINSSTTADTGGIKLFSNSGVNAAPATSGTTQTGGALRLRGANNAVLDMGLNSVYTWIQATDKANLANGYSLSLNPNGGNVGIGVSGPSHVLHVDASSTSTLVTIHNTNGSSSDCRGLDVETSTTGTTVQRWFNAGSELGRFTATGNLLVGKTTTAFGTAGLRFAPTGAIDATVSGDGSLFLNRLSSDGGLAYFYKDGTTVGSIGSEGGDSLYIQAGAASGSGLHFHPTGALVRPARNGATIDNIIDLGNSTRRFKDLYLSGGTYLGGTGAANKLDDYEEGTWTAGMSAVGGNTTAVNTVHGYYTKIGRNVNIYFYLNSINLALLTSGTYVILTGLPFQASAYSDFQWSYHRGGNAITGGYIQSGASYVYLVDSSGVEIQQGNNQTITALIGSAFYMTNS